MHGGFEFDEMRHLAENVKEMEKGGKQFIENFLYKMALRALAQTKRATPVDTGDLRAAWYLSGIVWRGDVAMVNLLNPKLYASWVEFGHWQEVGRYIPGHWEGGQFVYEQGADTGMVLRNPWVEGKYMMTLSIAEIERQLPMRLQAAWSRYAAGLMR